MSRLAKTVWVKDPERPGATIRLDAGQEVPNHLQGAVTNEDAWEDGKLPAAAKKAAQEQSTESETAPSKGEDEDDKPAAKKTAANRPARGRKSAGEGDS